MQTCPSLYLNSFQDMKRLRHFYANFATHWLKHFRSQKMFWDSYLLNIVQLIVLYFRNAFSLSIDLYLYWIHILSSKLFFHTYLNVLYIFKYFSYVFLLFIFVSYKLMLFKTVFVGFCFYCIIRNMKSSCIKNWSRYLLIS